MSHGKITASPARSPATVTGGELLVRTGAELVALSEVLYVRLQTLVLAFVPMMCAFAIAVAIARDRAHGIAATVVIAAAVAAGAVWALRRPVSVHHALRRGATWLVPIAVALVAFAADGAVESAMYFPAVTMVALVAVTAGRRPAVLGGSLLATGWFAVLAAFGHPPAVLLDTGMLPTVIGEAASFPLWGLLLGGMTERFATFTLHVNRLAAPIEPQIPDAPLRVPNLAGQTVDVAAASAPDPGAGPRGDARSRDRSTTSSQAVDALTARQLQVVALMRDGLKAAQIAERLGIKEATVYRHVEQAKRRLGVTSRHDLVAALVRAQALPPPAELHSTPEAGSIGPS